jgi:hypothetical protein
MSFIPVFGQSIANMFGMGSMIHTPQSQLSSELANAQSQLSSFTATSSIKIGAGNAKDIKMLYDLMTLNNKISNLRMSYNQALYDDNKMITNIHMLTIAVTLIFILMYIIIAPLPKRSSSDDDASSDDDDDDAE